MQRPFPFLPAAALAALAVLAAAASGSATAAECRTRSGPRTAALVELYTSEGCSSCPGADRWLSGLARSPASPDIVPIGFHVTYWDHIGWKDRFGDERFSDRQRAASRAAGTGFVYTPQVLVGGRDFRDWRSARAFERAIASIRERPARAEIEIAWRDGGAGGLAGTASAVLAGGVSARRPRLVLVAAQDGLSSRVTRGENRGETLAHDRVARALVEVPLASGKVVADFDFSPGTSDGAGHRSVVAFVQDAANGEVLQALTARPCP